MYIISINSCKYTESPIYTNMKYTNNHNHTSIH